MQTPGRLKLLPYSAALPHSSTVWHCAPSPLRGSRTDFGKKYFANARLHTSVVLCASGLNRLEHESGNKLKLDGQSRASLKQGAGQKARFGEEVVGFLNIAAHENVLPGNEGMIEHENGIVLVQTT